MTIRLAVFNDSASLRMAVRIALSGATDLEIVAEAADGNDAVRVVQRSRPDVILMDVVMPGKDGYAATRDIMATIPTPIVMMSGVVNPRDQKTVFEALAAGAVHITEQPPPPNHPSYASRCAALAELLRVMARARIQESKDKSNEKRPSAPLVAEAPASKVSVIAIVASAGGPGAVLELLVALPARGLPPLLIVQHLSPGFADQFGAWLSSRSGHDVGRARDGNRLERGVSYLAPDEVHLRVAGTPASPRVALGHDPPIGMHRPSATALLESMAVLGPTARAVILTGMGEDGAAGAVKLREAGGRIVAQDEASSVVYGMPKAALDAGGVDKVLPLSGIAPWLLEELTS